MTDSGARIRRLFEILRAKHGPQGWWPTTSRHGLEPLYRPGREGRRTDSRETFEIIVGAILTQNTAWRNAAAALKNLKRNGLISPREVWRCRNLEELIRSAGYFNQKADRLRCLARDIESAGGIWRLRRRDSQELRKWFLERKGVGPETADSILCYGFQRPVFVVDAYTARLFRREGIPFSGYEETRRMVEESLPADSAILGDFHALIVAEMKGGGNGAVRVSASR